MHRHGYQGTKFHRERDQREALVKGLAESLIIYGSIETTLPKAKAVVPYVERLITKAKRGDLHNRRQVIAALQQVSTANKLVDEVAPKLSTRDSGYFRIKRTAMRRGDNAEMARVSFVDDLREAPVAKSAEAATEKPQAKSAKKPAEAKRPAAAGAEKARAMAGKKETE